mmetsp:Transcript_23861/g.70797  ORF Transcript_23861/g.70797 Transcript_23861/m.70797 type:complete len:373 (-) Transcript_23861:1306-2424(-)
MPKAHNSKQNPCSREWGGEWGAARRHAMLNVEPAPAVALRPAAAFFCRDDSSLNIVFSAFFDARASRCAALTAAFRARRSSALSPFLRSGATTLPAHSLLDADAPSAPSPSMPSAPSPSSSGIAAVRSGTVDGRPVFALSLMMPPTPPPARPPGRRCGSEMRPGWFSVLDRNDSTDSQSQRSSRSTTTTRVAVSNGSPPPSPPPSPPAAAAAARASAAASLARVFAITSASATSRASILRHRWPCSGLIPASSGTPTAPPRSASTSAPPLVRMRVSAASYAFSISACSARNSSRRPAKSASFAPLRALAAASPPSVSTLAASPPPAPAGKPSSSSSGSNRPTSSSSYCVASTSKRSSKPDSSPRRSVRSSRQ